MDNVLWRDECEQNEKEKGLYCNFLNLDVLRYTPVETTPVVDKSYNKEVYPLKRFDSCTNLTPKVKKI